MTWLRYWPAAVAILAAMSGWQARSWRDGAAQAAELQAALAARTVAEQAAHAAAEAASEREVERLALEQERDALARQLEDAANADQVSGGGLPRARVERLRKR